MRKLTALLELEQYVNGLRAIIFDLDDTLYSEKDYVRSGYRQIAQAFPQIPDAENVLWQAFLDGKQAIDTFLTSKHVYSDELKQKCLSIYRNQIPDIQLYPDVRDMLVRLKKQGYALGMITDGRPTGQRAKIRALELESLVDEIIITDELGGESFRKPCPLAFEQMRERLLPLCGGSLAWSDMCYVGDNIRKDFVAPAKLGMKCFHFVNGDGLYC